MTRNKDTTRGYKEGLTHKLMGRANYSSISISTFNSWGTSMVLEDRYQESAAPSKMELEDRVFAQGFATVSRHQVARYARVDLASHVGCRN
jgi:hypothetical protein